MPSPSTAPVREQLRDARLSISVLVEQVGNGELANAKASSAALKVVIDALDVQIQAAATSAALTLL